jgi:hypothetical protein
MLSICIPHYNFINEKLFTELYNQCVALAIEYEILVIDDASEPKNKKYLAKIISNYCNVIFLEKNIGRSKIRNLLAQKAKYNWLLFLDGDSTIHDSNFLLLYLNNLSADIISGGRAYSDQRPNNEYHLHWNYGFKIESGNNAQFHSNNFIIKKDVFKHLTFDESITNYGYEDVVFGIEAKRLGLNLINLNNKVLHTGLKTNTEFLMDVEQALINLCKIEVLRKDLQIEKEVKILRNYNQLNSLKLTWLISIFNSAIILLLKKYLINGPKIFTNKALSVLKLYQLHHIKTYKK